MSRDISADFVNNFENMTDKNFLAQYLLFICLVITCLFPYFVVFWLMPPSDLLGGYHYFGGKYYLHFNTEN